MTGGAQDDGRIVLSVRTVRRDLWVSLAVLVVGIAFYLVSFLVRGGASSLGGALVGLVLAEAGWILILVGLLFVGVNWWLLRRREGGPRTLPPPPLDATPPRSEVPGSPTPAWRTHVACPNCARLWPAQGLPKCPYCGSPLPR